MMKKRVMEIRNSDSGEPNDHLEGVDHYDEYGFAVFKCGSKSAQCDDRIHDFRKDKTPGGVRKEWEKLFSKWMYYKNGAGVKLFSLIKKGVPENIRPQLWRKLLDIDILKSSNELFKYQDHADELRQQLVTFGVTEFNSERAEQVLGQIEMGEDVGVQEKEDQLSEPSIQVLRQIFLDVGRTFPTHVMFFGTNPCSIESKALLFRILGVYAKYNPSVGYCQGMSFIAGMLVMHLPEEEAFWCLVALLQKPKYFHGYFDVSLERVQRHARVFDWLLRQKYKDVWDHLHSYNIDPLMFVTPWLMCLFTSLPCWDCVLAIWDLMLVEGAIVIFRTALAILENLKPLLMEVTDVNGLILLLQKLPTKKVNRENLLPVIWKMDVQWWEIEQIHAMINDKDESCDLQGACLKWRKAKKKVTAQKFKKNDTNILRKIARIFNAKPEGTRSLHKNLPEIIVTPPTPVSVSDNTEGKPRKRLFKKFKSTSQERDGSGDYSNCSTVFEDVSRMNRIATGKRGRSRSTDRLEEVVDSLVGCGASQRFAFVEFAHQIPLRRNRLFNQSIGSGSEKELNSFNESFPCSPTGISLKRKRSSCIPGNSPGPSDS